MRRAGLVVALFALATIANAATTIPALTYRVQRGEKELVVYSANKRVRVHAPTALPMYDAVLTGDSLPVALNSELQTWFPLELKEPLGLESRFLSPGLNSRIDKLAFDWTATGSDAYEGRLTYQVRPPSVPRSRETILIYVDAKIRVELDPQLGREHWLGNVLPRTDYDDVNAKLREADRAITRLPRKLTLEVTRTYKGGQPMKDSMTVVVSDITETTIDPAILTRPASYRFQKPIILAPGVTAGGTLH